MKSILMFLLSAAGVWAAAFYRSNVQPQPQPQADSTTQRGPNYLAQPLPITANCRADYQDGTKPHNFICQPQTRSFVVGTPNGPCSEDVTIARNSYADDSWADINYDIPAPGVRSAIDLKWFFQSPREQRSDHGYYSDGYEVAYNEIAFGQPC